eukprot:scaffold4300_cov36-Tisochrysis_lutea.AAC.2
MADKLQVCRILEGWQDAWEGHQDGSTWESVSSCGHHACCRLSGPSRHASVAVLRRFCPSEHHQLSSVFAGHIPWICLSRFDGEWREGKPVVKDAHSHSPDFLAWLNDSVGAVTGPRRNKEYQRVSQNDDDE